MPNNQKPIANIKIGKAFYFDCSTKRLYTKQHTIELNRAEREVLYCLISHAPRMVSKAELLKAGWARKEVTTTSLFQTIRNLRIKLQEEEKGQLIELIPKLGYKINAISSAVQQYPETKEEKTESKQDQLANRARIPRPQFIAAFAVLAILATWYAAFSYFQKDQFYHQIVNDDDNNTIVFLTKNTEDLTFLQNHSDQYITPKAIHDRLFFIAKSKEYYSIAFCEKTAQNTCEPATARAVTFKHFDLSTFWPMLTEESLSIGAMSVYKGETKIKASAKSYNFYLEDGKISPNLFQYFIHKLEPYTWAFTGISYRMNNDKNEFVATSFKGGEFKLQKTPIEPFIAVTKTKPKYFYWINSKEELAKMGIKLPGQIESYVNSLYSKAIGFDSYMLYRQPGVYLWFSDEVGFYWLNQQGIESTDFSEFNQFEKCRDFLHISQNNDCD